MLRLGVSTYAFARSVAADWMSVDGLLDWAVEQGVEAVQFCENLPWPPDRPLPEGLLIETGCRGIGPHLYDHLRLAGRTGAGFVRLVIDEGVDEPTPDEAVDRLRPYADDFRRAGVVLAVENHDRFPAKVLRRIVESLGLGVVLDTANSLGCLEGLDTVVAELGPHVVNLHAKDVRARRKPDLLGFDIEGAPFGEGEVDWSALPARLPRLQSVTLEQWVPLESERDWAEIGVERLRTLIQRDRDRLVLGQLRRPEPIVLTTGTLTIELEPDSGWLRNIRRKGVELVRAVYGAARTPDWGTPAPKITDLKVEQELDGFRARYAASVENSLPFCWGIFVEGRGDGVTILFEGEALEDLRANRMGLCVLHPPGFAGSPCRVVHSDGSETETEFPRGVAPHQPFRNVAALDAPGVRVEFEGEVFETEDQRNWTDASFKTYSRPLDWPKPFRLAVRNRIRQSVRIAFTDGHTPSLPFIESRRERLPSLGVVSLAGTFPDDLPIDHVALPDGDSLRLVDRELRTLWRPDVFCATNFTELNRDRPVEPVDVMFAMNPQVHAFDWRTILESPEAQFDCAWTAREFARRVHIGPLSLNAKCDDQRSGSLVAAGWILASVAALAEAGAVSITFDPGLVDFGSPGYAVVADLHEFSGQATTAFAYPDLAMVELWRKGRMTLLFANLTAKPFDGLTAPRGRMRVLDETNVRLARHLPETWRSAWQTFDAECLMLPPYAYVRIDAEDAA